MIAANPVHWSIGLVGYGEVGRILAEDLRARGVENVMAYDIKFGTADDAPLLAHAAHHGVRPMTSHAFLAHAVLRRVRTQRRRVGTAELDVVGQDVRHAACAQILGEDASHLAVADEADGPLQGIGGKAHATNRCT